MRTFLLSLPAGLSVVVLGAHLLFHGQLPLVPPVLALLALLWVRRAWAARVLQAALVLGAAEWVRTALASAAARDAAGAPWLRMALILGAVALVSLLGAALLETGTMRRRFRGGGGADPRGTR